MPTGGHRIRGFRLPHRVWLALGRMAKADGVSRAALVITLITCEERRRKIADEINADAQAEKARLS